MTFNPNDARQAAQADGNYLDLTGIDNPGGSAPEPDILRSAYGALNRISGELNKGLPSDSKAHQTLSAATEALRAAARTIEKARNDGRSIANNSDLYWTGREERVSALVDTTEETVNQAVQAAQAAALVFRAQLEAELIPPAPRGQEAALATQQVEALMSIAADKESAFRSLGLSSDPAIAGLVLGDFGRVYAALAFGPELGAPLHKAMRGALIESALTSNDPAKFARAKTWQHAGRLEALAGGMVSAWQDDRQRLSGAVARVRKGLPA